jgi:hypothetical protein
MVAVATVPRATPARGAEPGRRRRPVTALSWRPVVWSLLFQSGWDALGLVAGGDQVYRGAAYDVLRLVPFGMSFYGPILAAVFVVTVVYFDRFTRGYPPGGLRVCLAVLAGWYAFWAAGTTAAWVVHQQIIAWPGPVRLAAVSFLFTICARTTPQAAQASGG